MSNIQKRNQNNKPQRRGEKSWHDLTLSEKKELSVAQKKQYLLDRYQKKKFDLKDIKQYGVFRYSEGETIADAELVKTCSTEEEALWEIAWMAEFHFEGNTDIAVQNDPRLETFENETQHVDELGKTIEPTDVDLVTEEDMLKDTGILDSLPEKRSKFKGLSYYANIDLDYEGTYFIMPIYPVFDPHMKK